MYKGNYKSPSHFKDLGHYKRKYFICKKTCKFSIFSWQKISSLDLNVFNLFSSPEIIRKYEGAVTFSHIFKISSMLIVTLF